MVANSNVGTLFSVRSRVRTGQIFGHRSTGSCDPVAYLRLPAILAVFGMLNAAASTACELAYDTYEIDVGDAKVLIAFTAQLTKAEFDDLVLCTRAGKVRQVSVYSFDGDTYSHAIAVDVPGDFYTDTWVSASGTSLLLARGDQLERLNPDAGIFEPWLDVGGDNGDQVHTPQEDSSDAVFFFNFSRDLNNDGLDDLVYLTEEGMVVRVQRPDGGLSNPFVLSSSLAMDFRDKHHPNSPLTFLYAMMRLASADEQEANDDDAQWDAMLAGGMLPQSALYALDYDGDGRSDLAVPFYDRDPPVAIADDDEEDVGESPTRSLLDYFGLRIHRAMDDGGWAAGAVRAPAPTAPITAGINGFLFAVQDINGDGVADVVVSAVNTESRSSRMLFYYGRREQDRTVFTEPSDTSIESKGMWLLTELSDLDGDGDVDFCAVPLKMGVGTVVGGLLRRSVRIELHCYRLIDGTYPEDPSESWRMRMRMNAPAPMTLADVTGDGLLDAVAPSRLSRLEVFPGTGGADLFVVDPLTIKLDLPKGGDTLVFRDLNRDGKADMLVVPEKSGNPVWVALSR